ncbi:glycosyltransferase [Bacteroides fragilis]
MIRSFRDPRIKIYLNENDKGYTSNFENALKKATGEIIFIADQDDIWKKIKLI